MSETGYRLARHLTLRQLQIFETIARVRSFTEAAEILCLTQPTVSMQVRKLSEAVGLPLFDHVGRQIHLTDAGSELLSACEEIFGALERLDMRVSEMKGLTRGHLRLAVVTTAKYFAPHVLGHFKKDHPGIDISLKVSNRDRVLERLMHNEDDLYIMGQRPEDGPELEAHPIAPNPLVVVAARDHPLVKERNIPLSRLADEPFISREPGSGIREARIRCFQEAGVRTNVIMELSSNEAIKQAVATGLGISVLSLHSLVLEGVDGPLAILDVEHFPIERYWYVAWPKGKKLSVVAQAFLEFLLEGGPAVTAEIDKLTAAIEAQHAAKGG